MLTKNQACCQILREENLRNSHVLWKLEVEVILGMRMREDFQFL